MLETEFKCLISKETYETLRDKVSWNSCREQINHYYADKNGAVTEKRLMIRVREIGGKYALQIKTRTNSGSPLQICEENEYEIDGVPPMIDAETIKRYTGEDIGDVYLIGTLKTKRRIYNWAPGTEICLDKSTYAGVTDYEIEVEYSGEVDKELLVRLSAYGVEFKQNSIGKFSRFYKRCNELNLIKIGE